MRNNLLKYAEIWGSLDEWPQGPEILKQIVMCLRNVSIRAEQNATDANMLQFSIGYPYELDDLLDDLFEAVPTEKLSTFMDRWQAAHDEMHRKIAKAVEPLHHTAVDIEATHKAIRLVVDWLAQYPEDNLSIIISRWFAVDLWCL